jgi:tRNA A-37 threonylcarbamoyl transferase component Bud32
VMFTMLKSAEVAGVVEQADAAILRWFTGFRTGWLDSLARGVDRLATGWAMSIATIALLAVTAAFRRWRHLFTFVGCTVVLQVLGVILISAFARPRPFGVTTVGHWQGFSLPSGTVGIVAATAVGVVYMLVPAGRPRSIAKLAAAALIAVVALARLLLGIDHPLDAIVAAALATAIPLAAFRRFVPNELFPVTYHPGKTAHLDVTGPRGEALVVAIRDQLGIEIDRLEPVGLAGSGGSTPLRMRVADRPGTFLFGKLYAMNHVRADRYYKLGRSVLYGRLEDESPFQSVRRLVEYEDYTLRVMRDAGISTPEPYGIVEVTPEREYLLVTSFVDGAQELGDATVDDAVIDEGLGVVRALWDAGLAHRDIKPANLLVKDGHIVVIDVAFAQVRPSPWREAVDLANMMLVLAVRSDASRVYRRALLQFSEEEVAEAFAATRGVASPSQLRAAVKVDGRDLVAEFRTLAPCRRQVSLQRWSARRLALCGALAVASAFALANLVQMFTPSEFPIAAEPSCGTSDVMVVMAQSVPSARSVPCLSALPAGWKVGGVRVRDGRSTFWFDSDQAGDRAVEVSLEPPSACSRREGPHVRTVLGDGGCVTYRLAAERDGVDSSLSALEAALDFQPRAALVEAVESETDLVLCGADAPPCAR